MYAVVQAGGRQYQFTSGRFVDVELLASEPDKSYVFEQVLMIVNGKESIIGKPFIEGAKVTGKIIGHLKNKKIIVYKYRPKKGTRKRTGHRQGFTRIFIDSIQVNDKVLSEAKDTKTPGKQSDKSNKVEKAVPSKESPKSQIKGTSTSKETKAANKTTKSAKTNPKSKK
jgi:large subunit ribosomal protein L21